MKGYIASVIRVGSAMMRLRERLVPCDAGAAVIPVGATVVGRWPACNENMYFSENLSIFLFRLPSSNQSFV